jgi:ATP-dependent Clp endopeptidase proteolytic subunit ClpP
MIYRRKGNKLTAYGSIWDGDGLGFIRELSALEDEYADIDVHIHTYGGSVFEGNLMMNAIENSRANICLKVDGVAASMGAILLLSRDNSQIVENGYIMLHNPSSGAYGNANVLEGEAKLLRLIESNFEKKLMSRTGKSLKVVKEWLSKDTWFSAQEALDLKLVSKVIPSKITPLEMDSEPVEMGEIEMYNRYAYALLTPPSATVEQTPNLNNQKMKQQLITLLALASVTAMSSDTAVLEAVEAKFNDLQSSLDSEKDLKAKAESKLAEFQGQQIKSMIEATAKASSKSFSDEEQKMYENIGLNSGVEALAHVLGAISKPTAPNLSGKIGAGQASAGRESWAFDQWQKEDPKGLEKLSVEDPAAFKELFNNKYNK